VFTSNAAKQQHRAILADGSRPCDTHGQTIAGVPLYLLLNSWLFLAAVADRIIAQAIASGHPKDLMKATHLENLQFCQVGRQKRPAFGSVQQGGNDDSVEDLHTG